MMTTDGAFIRGIGMMSAVGVGTKQTATSVAAGIARLAESAIYNGRFEPIVMGILNEDELPALDAPVAGARGITSTQLRLLRLASSALAEAVDDVADAKSLPLFLGAPEASAGRPAPVDARFLELLAQQSKTSFATAKSKVFPNGRASGFYALAAGMRALASGDFEQVLIGGVDSYVDVMLLSELDRERRLLGGDVMDGFIPGEGASILLVSAQDAGGATGPAIARVAAVATASEAGHRYGTEPYRGDGLAEAFRVLFERAGSKVPLVRSVWAGFNGENFNAKEWGTAFLRNRERFADPLRIEHPVDCFGDPGAALGPLLIGIAAYGMAEGKVEEPALVWCSSDREERAAALVRVAG